MCGLTGACGVTARGLDIDAMLDAIAHRGPDAVAWQGGDDWVLGHTRLAIQDLSMAANCPYRAGPITLTFNGEIWNHREIEVGPRVTTGDTEVVAKLLAQSERPADALSQLDGMWALAWHDERDGMIRLARDRWGKVPLYYAEDGVGTQWASEYKGLPKGPARAVPPGAILELQPGWGGVLADEMWAEEPAAPAVPPSPERVLELLRQGVTERLIGDRPIAFMLSGGLDSTAILAIAREQYQGEMVAYTAKLEPGSPDLIAARKVAAEFEVPLVEVDVPTVNGRRIAEAVRAVEVPHKAQVEIALAHLPVMAAMQSDGFAVCLSGEAADELFGGYGGTQIKASKADDEEYRRIKRYGVDKMARGNFSRTNKVGMAHGIETRLPFMQSELVDLALTATMAESPPGKKLLKEAVRGLVPDWVISRQKETFQGAVGTASHAHAGGFGVTRYNEIARDLFGHLPKE